MKPIEVNKFDEAKSQEDMQYKFAAILQTVHTKQKIMIQEEDRNLRQLDKIEIMQKSLIEDFQSQKDTLEVADKLKQRTMDNFNTIEKENLEEKSSLQNLISSNEDMLKRLQVELDKSQKDTVKLKQDIQN